MLESNLSQLILYNYPRMGRWIVVDINRDAKRRGIYPPLFTDPEGDSCFSIYQIRRIKNAVSLIATISSSETFAKRRAIFLSVRKTVNIQGYSKLGSQSNARKLLSTDLVNTKWKYLPPSLKHTSVFAFPKQIKYSLSNNIHEKISPWLVKSSAVFSENGAEKS